MNLFEPNMLFASLIWSSIGLGYFIYGKRQGSMIPMIAGILMIAASYFSTTALLMSAISLMLMAAVYWLLKEGY
jgi:hypothetical protein